MWLHWKGGLLTLLIMGTGLAACSPSSSTSASTTSSSRGSTTTLASTTTTESSRPPTTTTETSHRYKPTLPLHWSQAGYTEQGVEGWGFSPQTLSCPSMNLCVGASGSTIGTTTKLSGDVVWKFAPVQAATLGLPEVACPSTRLCVGVEAGSVAVSTNPTGGSQAWHLDRVDSGADLYGISCPSVDFCAAFSSNSPEIVTTTDPNGGTRAWHVTHLDTPLRLTLDTISCPSSSLCVAGGSTGTAAQNGVVFWSSAPADGAESWTETTVTSGGKPLLRPQLLPTFLNTIESLSCPSTSLCVGMTDRGEVVTTTDPTGGSGSWSVGPLAHVTFGSAPFTTCPEDSRCIAMGRGNQGIWESDHPAWGTSSWSYSPYKGQFLPLSCPTATQCYALNSISDYYFTVWVGQPRGS